jgi:hypothetical protein
LKTFLSEKTHTVLRPGICLALTAALLGPGARVAVAQTPPAPTEEVSNDPNVAEARTAFREGTSLARQAQWGEALLAFERSARLRPHTFTTYNLGYCERALGRYTRARKFLAKAIAENEARGGTAISPEVAADAKKYLAEIDQRLARATVTLSPADAAVSVDGRPLETVAADRTPPVLGAGTRDLGAGEVPAAAQFELLLDPGAHVFTVSRPGSSDLVVSRTFEAGSRAPLDLKLAVTPSPGTPAKSDVPSAASHEQRIDVVVRPSRTPGYVLLGVGAAGMAAGSVAGILALQQKHKLDESCKGLSCPPDLVSTRDTLNRWADVSTIAFGLGGASMILSTYALLWAASPSSKTAAEDPAREASTNGRTPGKTGVVIRPALGFGSAFVTGSF